MQKISFLFILFLSCNSNQVSKKPLDSANKDTSPIVLHQATSDLKQKADSFYNIDDYTNAKDLYTELIKVDSTNGEYYFKRGVCLSRLLYPKSAVIDYLKSIDLNYDRCKSYYNLGVTYSLLDDSLALIYFQKCQKCDPNYKG